VVVVEEEDGRRRWDEEGDIPLDVEPFLCLFLCRCRCLGHCQFSLSHCPPANARPVAGSSAPAIMIGLFVATGGLLFGYDTG
jgi:hypothetical protein